MKIMENIRRLIREIVGHVVEVDKLSNILTDNLINIVNGLINKIINYSKDTYSRDYEFLNSENFDSDIFDRINIETRFFKKVIDFKNNYVSGSFIDNKTIHKTIDSKTKYDIEIVLKIYNWDYKADLKEQINSVINHELHHAFDYTVRYGKKSISKILNHVKNDFKSGPTYLNKYKEYPEFQEFMKIFYLNLSEERNARIHQLYIEMLKFKDESIDDMIINMKRFSPFEDFKKMADFNNNFEKVPLEIKQEFIKDFNKILQNNNGKYKLDDNEINYPKIPDQFFNFWINQFHKNAEKLREKAVRIPYSIKKQNPPPAIIKEWGWNEIGNELSSEALYVLYAVDIYAD